MTTLISSLVNLVVLFQDAVRRSSMTVILPLI
jgi:hypothetical protein